MSHLQGGKVNIYLIQENARKKLLSLLEKCDGTKAIVWDEELAGPVGLIARYTLLREHGVVTMFLLQRGTLPQVDVNHVIFISRPKQHLMKYIAEKVHGDRKTTSLRTTKQFHLFFVPYKSSMCENILKHSGMYGSLTLKENFRCLLFPYDNDLIILGLPHAFR